MLSSKTVYGWDANSEDYHAHITRMERSLSIIPGAPPYPDVHKAFNNKPPFEEAQANPGKQRQPRKVSFQDQQGHSNNGSSQVVHEETDDVRVEAEGYIQQKHRGFELCKWKSFKPY